jgi:hypothetical protein
MGSGNCLKGRSDPSSTLEQGLKIAVLGIFLKQNRLTAPIRLSLDLAESSGLMVTATVIRRDLPQQAEDCVRWATIITGALSWTLQRPPPIRRGQFILDLRQSFRSWVSPTAVVEATMIWKKTRDSNRPQEAERITFSSNAPQCEKAIALLQAAIFALHNKLPIKITVKLCGGKQKLPLENLHTVLADFATRLSLTLSKACQYANHQPGGATQDKPLTYWVGAAAAVANQIVMAEWTNNRELQAILDEASQIEGVSRIQTQHDQRRFYTAFIVIRALKGTAGLKRLSALSPLTRGRLDPDKIQSQIESFHYTYVQPHTKKLQTNPILFRTLADFLRPRLLGPPGALAQDVSLPKNAF